LGSLKPGQDNDQDHDGNPVSGFSGDGDDHVDIRDQDLGVSIEPIANGALQELAPKLWAVF
jgi:hypothetical protein